jgi:hypothetical protein
LYLTHSSLYRIVAITDDSKASVAAAIVKGVKLSLSNSL